MNAAELIAIFDNASLIIQLEYIILLVMSLVCWAIIFAKALQFFRARKDEEKDIETIRLAETLDDIIKSLPYSDDTVSSTLIREGVQEYEQLEKVEASPGERARILLENVRQAMHEESFAISRRLSKGLGFLAMSANAAPLMGLFGTVWGIFHSFQGFSEMKQASIMVVGAGLAEALGTTIAGLLVAIPASVAYNFLVGRLGALEDGLHEISVSFLSVMKQGLSTVNGVLDEETPPSQGRRPFPSLQLGRKR